MIVVDGIEYSEKFIKELVDSLEKKDEQLDQLTEKVVELEQNIQELKLN